MANKRPESYWEARKFEAIKNHGLRYGLCLACACQIAWGHQNGFGSLESVPCDACVGLVAALPKDRPGGWRTVDGTAARWDSWPQSGA